MTIIRSKRYEPNKTLTRTQHNYIPPIPDGFCIVYDTREQLPYTFNDLKINSLKQCLGISGADYSIKGFEDKIRIERKSQSDFYRSIGKGRERFEKTIKFLSTLEFAGLVIECSEEELLCPETSYSNINANSIYGTIVSFQVKYGIHIYCGNRNQCRQRLTHWLLKFYKWKRNL